MPECRGSRDSDSGLSIRGHKWRFFSHNPKGWDYFCGRLRCMKYIPVFQPLSGQQSCSNAFQTHLSITYVEELHCVLSALSDTKIAASSGGSER